jgi:hypothetical protein
MHRKIKKVIRKNRQLQLCLSLIKDKYNLSFLEIKQECLSEQDALNVYRLEQKQ